MRASADAEKTALCTGTTLHTLAPPWPGTGDTGTWCRLPLLTVQTSRLESWSLKAVQPWRLCAGGGLFLFSLRNTVHLVHCPHWSRLQSEFHHPGGHSDASCGTDFVSILLTIDWSFQVRAEHL